MHAVIRFLSKTRTEEGAIGLIKSRNRPGAVQPNLAVLPHVEHKEACLHVCGNCHTLVI